MHNSTLAWKFVALLGLSLAVGCLQPYGLLITPGTKAPELMAAEWVGDVPDTEGKIVVVDVFGTWCPPCQKATPGLIKVYDEFHPQGVEFLALTSEETSEINKVKEFVEHFGVPWSIGVGAGRTIDQLGVTAVPTMIVIGKDGKVISVGDDEPRLRDTLAKAVAVSGR
jgi:thiol-disulfide isomerase/thioredoxin